MAETKMLRAGHYFMGVQGLAMIRDFMTDPAAIEPRADEIARIVTNLDEFPNSLEIPLSRYDVADGYEQWAPRYDGPNPAIATEQPIVAELLSAMDPTGVALDAACGTGRHSATLAAAGWDVIGVDSTPAMLQLARDKVPKADFREGRLDSLPVDDESVDLVICSLALTHVEELGPVLAEFGRVLRPGGRLVTTDMHPIVTATGGQAAFPVDDEGGPRLAIHYVPNLEHQVSEYVESMIGAGLTIERCIEPRVDDELAAQFPSGAVFPEATRRAFVGLPYLLIWQARKPD